MTAKCGGSNLPNLAKRLVVEDTKYPRDIIIEEINKAIDGSWLGFEDGALISHDSVLSACDGYASINTVRIAFKRIGRLKKTVYGHRVVKTA